MTGRQNVRPMMDGSGARELRVWLVKQGELRTPAGNEDVTRGIASPRRLGARERPTL